MKKQVKKGLETISSHIQRAKINSQLIDFLDDLLTEDEILDIAQRLQISKLLNRDQRNIWTVYNRVMKKDI